MTISQGQGYGLIFFYPKASISPLLNQCIEEGQIVIKPKLQSLVRIMKEFRRFHHAQEMSLCMTDCQYCTLTPSEAAIRLDLILMINGQGFSSMRVGQRRGSL